MASIPVMSHAPLWGTTQSPPLPMPPSPGLLVLTAQLGQQTRVGQNGIVQFNMPLVTQIMAHREAALPELNRILSTTTHTPTFLEALYTAEEMQEAGVQNVASLYPAVSKWNTSADPLVQIYLAGFYREINIPTTFGPMLATLVNRANTQYPLQASPAYNITEEVGGTVLKQIAETTANATVQKLLPYLSYNGVQQQR